MPLRSVNSKNAALNASLSGADAPATLYLALFNGNPVSGGTEVSGTNYARQPVAKASWSAASGGSKSNGSAINFLAGWTGTVTYVAFMSTVSGPGDIWDTGPTSSSITVGSTTAVSFAVGAIIVSES